MFIHCRRGAVAAVFCLLLVSCDSTGGRATPSPRGDALARDIGYSVLHKILADEQHLKTLRIAKTVITFQQLSEPTRKLIDEIATTSGDSLDQIEQLAVLKPPLRFDETCPAMLDQAILDALRVTTARDIIMASRDDFEINLVVSQIQALRITSHVLRELRDVDPNARRQAWLAGLAERYEGFYRRAITRLALAGG